MIAGERSYVVFADDWGEHPSSAQHLFRRVAQTSTVLWVNTIGMRAPRLDLGDLRKGATKLYRMLGGRRAPAVNDWDAAPVRVSQPAMLPYSGIPLIRRFNALSIEREVGRIVRQLGLRRLVAVTTVPNVCDVIDRLGAERIVYYCVDDFSSWPGIDGNLVERMERLLVHKADVLIATARRLQDRLSSDGTRVVHLLSHGVDMAHFGAESAADHEALAKIPRPRACYIGLFDERSDQDLIRRVSMNARGFSFVIAGPVVTAVRELQGLPNVHFVGRVPYPELPKLIAGCDVLLIPYQMSELAESISPLKLKEYMATGKPIIATPLREVRAAAPYVTVAASPEEWVRGLQEALHMDVRKRRRDSAAALATESWECKAREFEALCWPDDSSK